MNNITKGILVGVSTAAGYLAVRSLYKLKNKIRNEEVATNDIEEVEEES